MTSIEWLVDNLFKYGLPDERCVKLVIEAMQMHKQEIIDAYNNGDLRSADLYYQETFVSKGSDEEELPKQKNLYTEEQLRKAICTAWYDAWYEGALKRYKVFTMVSDTEVNEIIQSLKQPKKD